MKITLASVRFRICLCIKHNIHYSDQSNYSNIFPLFCHLSYFSRFKSTFVCKTAFWKVMLFQQLIFFLFAFICFGVCASMYVSALIFKSYTTLLILNFRSRYMRVVHMLQGIQLWNTRKITKQSTVRMNEMKSEML